MIIIQEWGIPVQINQYFMERSRDLGAAQTWPKSKCHGLIGMVFLDEVQVYRL